jgi:hypothetical protein
MLVGRVFSSNSIKSFQIGKSNDSESALFKEEGIIKEVSP